MPVNNSNGPPPGRLTDSPHPTNDPPLIEIIPLGRVDEVALSVTAANIQAIIGLNARVAESRPEPEYAVIPARQQYNALPILKNLNQANDTNNLRLGLTTVDLCLPFLSYVFGEAQVNGRTAVVSLYRLNKGPDGRPASRALLYERLVKIILHETAHILGLIHCHESSCLMHFSLGLEQLDHLAPIFCRTCEKHIYRAVISRQSNSGAT
jgi:archaemetzincin